MFLALLALVACSSTPPVPAGHAFDDASLAPAPFSIDELRAYNQAGRSYVFHSESPGHPTYVRTMTFLEADETGATVRSTGGVLNADMPGDRMERKETWAELQAHAAYPVDGTTRSWSRVELPGGPVDCLLYTVDEGEGRRTEACFDLERPGPPVSLLQAQDDSLVFHMTLQASSLVSPRPAGH